MSLLSDEYTESTGSMEEVSKKIRNAHKRNYGGKKNLSEDMERRMKGLYERKVDQEDPNRPSFEEFSEALMKQTGLTDALDELQAPEELPEGAGVDESEETSEVEEQEVPGNFHENEPNVMEDGTPEPPTPTELSDKELQQDPLEVLGEDEQKAYMDEMMASDGWEYRDEEDDPYKQMEKSNSSLARAARAKREREEKPEE